MPSVVFMGRKPGAAVALEHLIAREWDIVCVVAPGPQPEWLPRPTVADVAREAGLPSLSYSSLLEELDGSKRGPNEGRLLDVEWVFSYLFPYRVRPPVLTLPSQGALNFHPAPLPEYGGLGGYNFAIVEGQDEYGVTCHFMDEHFDTGDLVRVDRFPIHADSETVASLEARSQKALLSLLVDIVAEIERGHELPRIPQQGGTRYIDRAEFEEAKLITERDDAGLVERRARAFWYPPYEGAKVEIAGQHFTLVPAQALCSLGEQTHRDAYNEIRAHYEEVLRTRA